MVKDKILALVRRKGLTLPIEVSNELKKDTFIAGAYLSELAKSGQIKISNTKVGGSPVYYVKEHTYKLETLYKYLDEKDKKAYDLLKEKNVLRDRELTPLLRVSLRNIKDFAKPVEVTTRQGKELFWRWFLFPIEQAEPIIKGFFGTEPKVEAPQKKEEEKEQDKKEKQEAKVKQEEEAKEDKKEGHTQAKEKPKEKEQKEEPRKKEAEQKESQKDREPEETQEKAEIEEPSDALHEKIKTFFNNKGIVVLDIEVIRKNSEIDYIVEVPTPVGRIEYLCKAKQKKRLNDSDLATAYVAGQAKKLPVLYLSTGELTKKAKDMLGSFKNLKVLGVDR